MQFVIFFNIHRKIKLYHQYVPHVKNTPKKKPNSGYYTIFNSSQLRKFTWFSKTLKLWYQSDIQPSTKLWSLLKWSSKLFAKLWLIQQPFWITKCERNVWRQPSVSLQLANEIVICHWIYHFQNITYPLFIYFLQNIPQLFVKYMLWQFFGSFLFAEATTSWVFNILWWLL